VVDATNYVMVELGQPLHAFDFDLLEGRQIIVRRARVEECIRTLDGVDRPLSCEMLVIADATSPVAVAGVMGGAASEVRPDTRNVLLESACFNPLSIRRTSRALGLCTEASYRFERGVDREGTVRALDRAAFLILETAGGIVARGVADEYVRRWVPLHLSLRVGRVNQILGATLEPEEMARTLRGLGFTVAGCDGGVLEVTVPSFRSDVFREVDLVEEVARLYGFDRIPTTLPSGRPQALERREYLELERLVRRVFTGAGFYEAINFGFTKPQVFDNLKINPDNPLRQAVRVQNPLSEEQAVMRTELLSGLLRNLADNENQGVREVKLFELGRTYHPQEGSPLPRERRRLAAIAAGMWSEPFWKGGGEGVDFYHLKGILSALGEALGLEVRVVSGETAPFLHPARSARVVVAGREIGFVGQVHPEVAEEFELYSHPYYLEVDMEVLAELGRPVPKYIPLPKFPAVVRDVALLVREEIPAASVHCLIQEVGGEMVGDLRLFDLFRGGNVPSGYKSLAFSISYRAGDRTLTNEEVNALHGRVLEGLRARLGAVIR